jgi:hypothetical protein
MRLLLLLLFAMSAAWTAQGGDDWRPPAPIAGKDAGFDWIELRSGEWLKGRIKSMQDEKLEFDSEELDVHEFKWKDIRTVRSPRLLSVRLGERNLVNGSLLVASNTVHVITPSGEKTWPRAELLAITPTGDRELDKWSADISAGVSFRSGNTHEAEYNVQAIVQRRTPLTRLTLGYTGNYGRIDGVETENNHRGLAQFDVFLSNRLFVRVPDIDYYHDPLQNLEYRLTAGAAVGYDIIKTARTEWDVTIGPAYQKNQYVSVEPGTENGPDSLAAVLSSRFDVELTKRIDLILEYRGQFTTPNQGSNMHHGSATLEFEIHKKLTLDMSFVWDRVAKPETGADGITPKQDDFRFTTSLGIHF